MSETAIVSSAPGDLSKAISSQATERVTLEAEPLDVSSRAAEAQFSVPTTSIHKVEADGVRVFYRAAGDPRAPVLLLLHGFPASSFMFRELIPRLADRYRVIAPDLPGFGFTEVPAERKYVYSFDGLATTIEAFTDALKINRYAIYVFDYGAPTGFRLAMAHPERVTAIVSQNGNAYEEGLGDAWGPIRKYWSVPTAENREVHPEKHFDTGRNAVAIHARRSQSRQHCARVVHTGCGAARTSGEQRNSAGFVSGLRVECEALSEISGIFSSIETTFACDLGQE